jgi:flagellar motor protein MotB
MNEETFSMRKSRGFGAFPAPLLVVLVALVVGGCASTDGLSLGRLFERDQKKTVESQKNKGSGAETQKSGTENTKPRKNENTKPRKKASAFPSLGTVPKRPKVTSPERRLVIEEGLLADRERARYTTAKPPWARPKVVSAAAISAGAGGPVQTVTVAGSRLATIRFAVGSARMPPGAVGLMRQIVALQRRSGGKVIAVGHTTRRKRNTDLDKDKKIKDTLSVARANAVIALLARAGVRRDRLEAIGRGDTEPTNPRRPFMNRRVDIFLQR